MPEPKSPVIVGLEQQEVVYAKGQPQYLALPALRTPDGRVMSRWELTPEERVMIANGADIFITAHTFNEPLQPMRVELMWKNSSAREIARELGLPGANPPGPPDPPRPDHPVG